MCLHGPDYNVTAIAAGNDKTVIFGDPIQNMGELHGPKDRAADPVVEAVLAT